MAAVGGAVAIEADGWALRIDAASVHRAAVQEVYGGAAPPAAPPRLDYRWLGRYDQPVLTFGREAAADGAVWRRIAARHARTLPTVEARVGRPGGEATISADVALRLWTELVATRRITFDVTTGDSSAEVFPNVPLVDPHLAGGFLYAGEPARRDAHLHVRAERLARVRFVERHLPDGRIWHVARLIDAHGYSLCDAWFPNPYRAEDGSPLSYDPAAEPEKTRLFGDLSARYEGVPGIEYLTERPFEG